MNSNFCPTCKKIFDLDKREPVKLSESYEEVCKDCFSKCSFGSKLQPQFISNKDENSFVTPFKIVDSESKVGNSTSFKSSNFLGGNERKTPELVREEISQEDDLLRQDSLTSKKERGNEMTLLKKSSKSNELNRSIKVLNYCELHPNQILDVICVDSKCRKFVCLECVAFGNHAVC